MVVGRPKGAAFNLNLFYKFISFRGHMGPNKDGRNFFLWLVFMVFIFVGMAVLEKVLEVPAV